MKKIVLLFITGLTVLMSCNKPQTPEFYLINGEIENFEGEIYLIRTTDTIYYLNNFRQDTATVRDGKFEFRLSTKCKTPLPFRIRTENSMTASFILEPQNQSIKIDSINSSTRPRILTENSIINSEYLILDERRRFSKEEIESTFKRIYSSNYSNDSIEKLAFIARGKYNEQTLSILKDFSKDYTESFVSFWFLVSLQFSLGNHIEIENAYENLSPNIKNTEVGKIFEQRMLMSKMVQKGSYFPEVETN
jgi:hypothetical protein